MKEYKHEIFVLVMILIILKIGLAITGKMPLFSFSFVEMNDANTALNAGTQAAQDVSRIS